VFHKRLYLTDNFAVQTKVAGFTYSTLPIRFFWGGCSMPSRRWLTCALISFQSASLRSKLQQTTKPLLTGVQKT
jgi:hypothetical protein